MNSHQISKEFGQSLDGKDVGIHSLSFLQGGEEDPYNVGSPSLALVLLGLSAYAFGIGKTIFPVVGMLVASLL